MSNQSACSGWDRAQWEREWVAGALEGAFGDHPEFSDLRAAASAFEGAWALAIKSGAASAGLSSSLAAYSSACVARGISASSFRGFDVPKELWSAEKKRHEALCRQWLALTERSAAAAADPAGCAFDKLSSLMGRLAAARLGSMREGALSVAESPKFLALAMAAGDALAEPSFVSVCARACKKSSSGQWVWLGAFGLACPQWRLLMAKAAGPAFQAALDRGICDALAQAPGSIDPGLRLAAASGISMSMGPGAAKHLARIGFQGRLFKIITKERSPEAAALAASIWPQFFEAGSSSAMMEEWLAGSDRQKLSWIGFNWAATAGSICSAFFGKEADFSGPGWEGFAASLSKEPGQGALDGEWLDMQREDWASFLTALPDGLPGRSEALLQWGALVPELLDCQSFRAESERVLLDKIAMSGVSNNGGPRL